MTRSRKSTDTQVSGVITRTRAALLGLRKESPGVETEATAPDVTSMLGELGATLLASSQATNDVEDTLNRLAVSYARPELRIFVLPTLVLIEDTTAVPAYTSLYPTPADTLRLDQSAAVDEIVHSCLSDATAPAEVIAALESIRRQPPRFGRFLTVIGYMLLTVGFGLVLNPSVTALPVYAASGILVGAIMLIGTRTATLSLVLPVLTSFAVTLLISLLVRPVVDDDVVRLVAPSLVSFLPGLTLTIAAVELTSGQVMAGASRLVYGVARLGLLAFGVYAGVSVSGVTTSASTSPPQLGAWAPWVGIALVSLGYYLFSAAPRRSLVWILYALVVAYSAQLLGSVLLGAELSGLVGALVAIPAIYLAGRLRRAPSTAIMLTCAYWLLVPGSMGFIGVTEAAAGTDGASTTIVRTFGSLIAIAIGMLLGAGLSKDVSAVHRSWRDSNPRGQEPE